MFWLPYSSHTTHHPSQTPCLPRISYAPPKAVWSIPYVSVAFFPSLKQNFIAYRSSKVSSHLDSVFEIHQLWQSGFSRVYSDSCCSCSFEAEIIEIGQSSHKMFRNNTLNFQVSTPILNACTKKSRILLKAPRTFCWIQFTSSHVWIYIYIYACVCVCVCDLLLNDLKSRYAIKPHQLTNLYI